MARTPAKAEDRSSASSSGQGLAILEAARRPAGPRLPVANLSRAGKLAVAFAVGLLGALLFGLAAAPVAESQSCTGKQVRSGNDLDAIVNADPGTRATTFCVHPGTYYVNETIRVRAGDKIIGRQGTYKKRGPAVDPKPVVKIVNSGRLPRIFDIAGSGVRLGWLEIQGSRGGARYTNDTRATCANWGEASNRCPANGTGTAIAAGRSGADALFHHLVVHHNPSNCITGMSGRLVASEFHHCSQNADYWGYTAGALKTTREAEVARSYVHDNEAVGLWCDQGCDEIPARANGFWVHDNLVVRSGRAGIRYEFSPMPGDGSRPTALAERNRLAANKGGGADMHDAQNAIFRRNVFGRQTIAGIAYGHNGSGGFQALQFSDSGRADRTKLRNGKAFGNYMRGETIGGCHKPDVIVDCSGNR